MSIFLNAPGDGTEAFEVRTPRQVAVLDGDGNPVLDGNGAATYDTVYDDFTVEKVNITVVYDVDGVTITNMDDIYNAVKPYEGKHLREFLLTVDSYVSDDNAFALAANFVEREIDGIADQKEQNQFIYHMHMLCFYIAVASRNAFPANYGDVSGADKHATLVNDTLLYGFRLDPILEDFRVDWDIDTVIAMRTETVARGTSQNYPVDWIDVISNSLGLLVFSAHYGDRLAQYYNDRYGHDGPYIAADMQ